MGIVILWEKLDNVGMSKVKDGRKIVKLNSSNSLWIDRLVTQAACGITVAGLVNEAVSRSRVWLETNTPRKSKP